MIFARATSNVTDNDDAPRQEHEYSEYVKHRRGILPKNRALVIRGSAGFAVEYYASGVRFGGGTRFPAREARRNS